VLKTNIFKNPGGEFLASRLYVHSFKGISSENSSVDCCWKDAEVDVHSPKFCHNFFCSIYQFDNFEYFGFENSLLFELAFSSAASFSL